jgi:hypothetical protein
MKLASETRGQAIVITVVMITALLGMCALVLDVGSWFRADRATQATADAAALAGAQALPVDPAGATGSAVTYATKNGGGATSGDVTITSSIDTNDTISVHVHRQAESFFSKVFGLGNVDVGSKATARTDGIAQAKYVAPIGVPLSHEDLSGGGCPCFDSPTTLELGKAGVPGAFHLVNLDASAGGTTGSSTLADWITSGFDAYLGLGGYFSDTGAKWNSSSVQDALSQRVGTDLLFPVYDSISGTGSNAAYHVIGWVGFHLTGFEADGVNNGQLYGSFTRVIWDGIQVTTAGEGGPDFGVRTVQLVG